MGKIIEADLLSFFAWVFNKKKCKHCGANLKRRYKVIDLKREIKGFRTTGDAYKCKFILVCDSCGKTWNCPLK